MRFSITLFSVLTFAFLQTSMAQNNELVNDLVQRYDSFKEKTLESRRIKHSDIVPLIEALQNDPTYSINKVGESMLGKAIYLISLGEGETNVFLWSQMHGDEPTATQAIFDILNFFNSEGFEDEKSTILENTTLHFMPMVNPDGAENFTRRNVLSIDLNRDALRLQTPEAQALKKVRDSLEADFGFNLHDQSTYYNAEGTPKPATISFLAPAYNFEKEINPVRKKAMQIIVSMNRNLQQLVPGQIGRYNDDFEPRAFGDNFQKWGTSTILIESGGYKDDSEKQEIRKLNFVSIISALLTIANETYNTIDISEYEKIPNNDRKLFDLKINGATYQFGNNEYIIDLGINHNEIGIDNQTDYYNVGGIMDIGDLSTSFGYETLDAEGYKIVNGKLYDQAFADISKIDEAKAFDLLSKGFTHIRVNQLRKDQEYVNLPIQILGPNAKQPKFDLNFGRNPTFLLSKGGKFEYAVVNGFLVDLNSRESRVRNGLIIR